MSILNVISLLGGLALFLYGITLMGDALNLVAGDRLEVVLYRLTSNRFRAILLGVLVTAVIQSSSAASIMCVGFVNSGLMQFSQAVAVVLGSILGSSVTGWIVCLSSMEGSGGWVQLLSTTAITGIIAVIGIYLRKFQKDQKLRHAGDILMGFAVLMFGMSAMSAAVEPLQGSPTFLSLLTTLSNPILGILAGAAFTAVIQSSAAAVGILQALSLTGHLTIGATLPLLLGIAIGGALPVLMGALGANTNGVRTAAAHLMIDVLGAVICGGVFYIVDIIHPFAFMNVAVSMVGVAAINTLFRLFTVIVLAPFIGVLDRLTRLFIPDRPEPLEAEPAPPDPIHLEKRFIRFPALALEQSREVIDDMARLSRDNLAEAVKLLDHYSEDSMKVVMEMESLVDRYEDALGSYLLQISTIEFTREQNENLHKYLHVITDLERISDHAANIAESAEEISEKQVEFHPETWRELQVLQTAVTDLVDLTISAFIEDNLEQARRIEPFEDLIDVLCDKIRNLHISRLQSGDATLQSGFVFNDLITNYERIGDHCSNVGVALIELEHDVFDTHEYLDGMKKIRSSGFSEIFEEYREKYSI